MTRPIMTDNQRHNLADTIQQGTQAYSSIQMQLGALTLLKGLYDLVFNPKKLANNKLNPNYKPFKGFTTMFNAFKLFTRAQKTQQYGNMASTLIRPKTPRV